MIEIATAFGVRSELKGVADIDDLGAEKGDLLRVPNLLVNPSDHRLILNRVSVRDEGGLASVREGALLFNESARTKSVGMSAAEFRHGPVEVVSPSFFAFVFASQPATAALDRQLTCDIVAAGGHALEIGPRGSELPSIPWTEGVLAPVVEIVVVQIAAWWLAGRKGIAAGSFQFAPLITSSEAGFEKPARTE